MISNPDFYKLGQLQNNSDHYLHADIQYVSI